MGILVTLHAIKKIKTNDGAILVGENLIEIIKKN